MMRDFLGNEYDVDDLVLYAAASGRCITMVIGRVVSINERTSRDYCDRGDGQWAYKQVPVTDKEGNPVYSVRIQPLDSSRWRQHDPRTYYTDSRDGKRIDKYKHVKEHGHYIRKSTGESLPDGCHSYYIYKHDPLRPYTRDSYKNPDYVPMEERDYVPTVFEDYVEEHEEGPKPVTITVTENIVKWSGELPDVP